MKRTPHTPHPKTPRQLTIALDAPAIAGLGEAQRAKAVELLAQLLLEACGARNEEDGDEDV